MVIGINLSLGQRGGKLNKLEILPCVRWVVRVIMYQYISLPTIYYIELGCDNKTVDLCPV